VVFDEDETHYRILTCEHGTLQQDRSIIRLKAFVAPEEEQAISEIAVKAELLKHDRDIDIALMVMPKVDGVRIRPLKLADATLMAGTECVSYGYVNGKFIRNNVSTLTYNGKELIPNGFYMHTTNNGKNRLVASGDVISGMSGGALVYQSQIFGIQSSGVEKKRTISYCPSDVVWEFIGRSNGK